MSNEETHYYDSIANGYDKLYLIEQLRKLTIIKNNLNIKKKDRLLDVGCGSGISSRVFNCSITGIDKSERMVEVANTTENKNFKAIVGKAEKLPFKDKSFDKTICVTAIHNFENPEKAIEEIIRVTKEGKNNIAISVLKKSKKSEHIKDIISKSFNIKKIIIEEKDTIFILEHKRTK